MYRPRSRAEWVFLGATVGQAFATTILEIAVLFGYFAWINPEVYQVPSSYVVPVNFALIVFGGLYLAILAIDAVRVKNNLQVFGVCICNVCLCVFTVMRYYQTEDVVVGLSQAYTMYKQPLVKNTQDFWSKVQPALLASTVLVGLVSVVVSATAYQLHREFAWAIYRHISGDRAMRRRYLAYQILLVLIKIEFYFFIAFIIVYGLVNVHYEYPEFPLTMSLVPVAFIQIGLAIYFTRTEGLIGAVVALVIRLAQIAYLISRIVVLCGHGWRSKTALKDEMLLYAGCSLAFAVLACVVAVICMFNFGHGLRGFIIHTGRKEHPGYDFAPIENRPYVAQRLDLD